ncbi:organic cation transporter protein [Tribolium castaneum]|uniref:Organic cation transporter-like protein n=1 Tax=Tribolium castaneum TaxID=7070 RepID=A0A139WNF8_TRICA|nr:PREDICTED: organic cation transporter protein [Tribolium castaneum]KYB29407.1 Organic cation transporter-like protein [Tribolium castaneum]|eukprot:XP_008200798.2 PREDICTED: organic cation transporter protein [Tribolium castaneum]
MSQLESHCEHEEKPEEDIIQSTIGNFGRWQFKISALMALLKFPIAWFQMSIVFLAPPTQFWCKSNESSTNEWLKMSQQNHTLRHEGLNSGFCQSLANNTLTTCQNGYEYNRTVFNSSIITEWNLVCENKRLVDVSQISLMFGVLLGNILFGVIADRKGRKKTLLVCVVFQSLLGIAASQIPWYWGFIVTRFLLAIANGGTIVISFVMCMEVVGGTWRSIVPILYQIPYGFGNSIMAGIAYFHRDWRDLHLVLSLISSFYILYLWLVPESPRWLLATGNKSEAIKILERAAQCNKMDSDKVKTVAERLSPDAKSESKPKLAALFATTELTKRNVLLCINWLIAGITFYAFSQYIGKVGSNLYFTAAISGFVAFPGTLLCVFIIRRFGRRLTIASAHVLTAICFFGILAVPLDVYYQDWPRVVIAGIGIVGLSISMPALYLFTGELFPTTVRNAGVGTSVMFSRMGSMISPLVISMQDISPSLPLIVLGTGAILETFLILLLPETKGMPLPETIDDLSVTVNKTDDRKDIRMCYISLPTILKDTSLDINK